MKLILKPNAVKLAYSALFWLGIQTSSFSQSQVSTPIVGFVKDSLPANSDTIATMQLQRPSEFSGAVSSVSESGSSSTLALGDGAALSVNQFVYVSGSQPKSYYVLVTAGTLAGSYFSVTSNSSSSVTVDNSGVSLAGVGAVSALEVRPFWTIGTLFPASDANVSFVPSAGSASLSRRTKILLPNNVATGVNKAARGTYFFRNDTGFGYWVSEGALTTNANDTIIFPDEFVIIRHNTTASLALTITGSVLEKALTTYAGSSTTVPNDTLVGLPRPTDYKLSDLGLSDSNFVASTGTSSLARRDQLLVISKTGSGFNRAAAKTYYRFNNSWYLVGSTTPLTDGDPDFVIPTGSAVIMRKFKTASGSDSVVVNQPNF
jgi:uncharacterized protein (TIGR02597 family)